MLHPSLLWRDRIQRDISHEMFQSQRQRFQSTDRIKGNFMSGMSMVPNNPQVQGILSNLS